MPSSTSITAWRTRVTRSPRARSSASAARTRGRPAEPLRGRAHLVIVAPRSLPGSALARCDDVASNPGGERRPCPQPTTTETAEHRADPAPARARRAALPGRDVRLRRAAARAGLGHAGRDRGAAAVRHRRGRRAGRRGGPGRVHARDAARLRRRPHRRHRQHHPQADGRAAAADVGRLLVLPRPLHDRLRAGRPDRPRRTRPGRSGRRRGLGPAADHRRGRGRGVGHLPDDHRHRQPGGAGRASSRCSGGCGAGSTTRRRWSGS